jgi:hypothetical protein
MHDRAHSSCRLTGPSESLHGEVDQAIMVHWDGCAQCAEPCARRRRANRARRFFLSLVVLDVRYRSLMLVVISSNCTCASSRAPNPGVRLMNWASRDPWAVKIDLMEESYIQGIQLRDVDEGHKVL